MRALAITGMETALMIPSTMSGSDIRDTPPWARMSAGTRSSAITATAPASSAIFACSGVTTSMITPPLSISAIPRLTRAVPVTWVGTDSDTSSSSTPPGVPANRTLPIPGPGTACEAAHTLPAGLGGGAEWRLSKGWLVDVEEARRRVSTGQPEQPDQQAAAHREGVAHQVGVQMTGQG